MGTILQHEDRASSYEHAEEERRRLAARGSRQVQSARATCQSCGENALKSTQSGATSSTRKIASAFCGSQGCVPEFYD